MKKGNKAILMLIASPIFAALATMSFSRETLVSPIGIQASEKVNSTYYFGGISFYITAATILATLAVVQLIQKRKA